MRGGAPEYSTDPIWIYVTGRAQRVSAGASEVKMVIGDPWSFSPDLDQNKTTSRARVLM